LRVYIINVTWDCHGEVWCGVSDELALSLECSSFDGLIERVKVAALELSRLNNCEPVGMLHFVAERREGVV